VDPVIRPIRASDKGRLQAALGRLSGVSVRHRFLAAKDRLSTTELRYLTEVDHESHIALVAELGGEIVAVVRCVRDLERPDTAEVAYVVADDQQRRGLGTRMLSELALLATARGVRRFTATMAAENDGARKLLLTLGEPEHETCSAGVREMTVATPAAMPAAA
jgi:GNAT superfamily N-acetyltransferase